MQTVIATGSFDNLGAREVRFLEEAARLGRLQVYLWDDPEAQFPLAERRYFLEALRWVDRVLVTNQNPLMLDRDWHPQQGIWVWPAWEGSIHRVVYCQQHKIPFRVITAEEIAGFPNIGSIQVGKDHRKKVIVTGCYDYVHSGHVRFFEEASTYGELYVVVGSDANVRLLKGDGHPFYPQEQRRYMVSAVRFVHAALVSTGVGWMDAAPEIERIRPDIYLVNEDGDKPEKRQFCLENGLEYVVLERAPAPGLPRRTSTELRGY
jgi:cytidyltransferase-like protein